MACKEGTHPLGVDTRSEQLNVYQGAVPAPGRPLPMRSLETVPQWLTQLLPAAPEAGAAPPPGGLTAAQRAGAELLRALLLGFTTNLAQLARQVERAPAGAADPDNTARRGRQYLTRWLNAPAWDPTAIYTHLGRFTRRELHRQLRQGDVLLLVDCTTLAAGWLVLQVSLPWQGRALPLFRAVTEYQDPEETLPELLGRALAWLGQHLPGSRRRYVLVADRGFPSHPLVQQLQADGWRFVLRIKGNWKFHHPRFTGGVRALAAAGRVGPTPWALPGGWWGQAQAGRHCTGTLVAYWGAGHQEPWFLITSETDAARAVALYRRRMQIEQAFRDLKGRWGLDHLRHWGDRERVARFLAWVAVYEWRLAYLWLVHRLATYQERLRVHGKVSWITTVREWLRAQLRSAVPLTDLRL